MSILRIFNWRIGVLLLLGLAGVVVTLFLKKYVTTELLAQYQTIIAGYVLEHWMTAVVGYLFAYIIIASLSLPFIGVLSAGAGYLFGLGTGAAIVIFGLSLGTLCGFLLLRFLCTHNALQEKEHAPQTKRYKKVADVVSRRGTWILLFFNAVFMLPAFAINMIALFNQMSWWTVTWTSVVGGLPYLVFNVWIGHQLRIAGSEILIKTPSHYVMMTVILFCLILIFLWYFLGVIRIRFTRYLERIE